MTKGKNLSNPFSTGGGGAHFEAHVQASFVTLMLTGGHAPCLPCWPIAEILLQGKINGFETDDLIVVVENSATRERRKLLGQVKHTIAITKGSALLGEVIQAAWNDFNNPKVFTKNKDIIALITGPLSATDVHNVQWLLDQARHTTSADEYFRNVKQAKFSPPQSMEKLDAFRHHLELANNGTAVSNDVLYEFLNHFHLLGYDLGKEGGVVLSLLHSHISQFQQQYPEWVWARVVDIVQSWNQDAGTITPTKLPDDLLKVFEQRVVTRMPEELKEEPDERPVDWTTHPDATHLALAILIGAWNDHNQHDIEMLARLLGIEYGIWLQKAREILLKPGSPLALKNGAWKVVNRPELWKLLGSRILDQNLDIFKKIAVSVLSERDPSLELPSEERYTAAIQGKVLKYSHELRSGIAEGLAILGSNPDVAKNCSTGKAAATPVLAIRELFTSPDWMLWGSLNRVMPDLAEAAPEEFLGAIENALRLTPCPFDDLFAQEGTGIYGSNYLTGLLWGLEGLAWDDNYLVRVCVLLGELAHHDPGGQWANRPSSSLSTILLPWLPQTLAPIEKRKVAVETLINEWPDIGWDLVVELLPGQLQSSSGSHKPQWRNGIPERQGKGVPQLEYWQQVLFYAELAVRIAGNDVARLSKLIDHLENLPNPAFGQLMERLSSPSISDLPEKERLLIWDHLSKFANKHRRYADAKWALPDAIVTQIETVAGKLAPRNPFNLHQPLFTDRDFDLYEKNDNWEEQRIKLDGRRDMAVDDIYRHGGIGGVISFSETVESPGQVGRSLGLIMDVAIEQALLPNYLDASIKAHLALVSGYIWRRQQINGWEWCDKVDKSRWTPEQIGALLACMPFTKEAWDRADRWLGEKQKEYWSRTSAFPYHTDGPLDIAIDKLIEYGRPFVAINCLARIRPAGQPISVKQCAQALLAARTSDEPGHAMDGYHIVELIKYLQSEPATEQEDLFKIEWAYLPLLNHHAGAAPILLEKRLASDPEFYCEVIRLIFRSTKEEQSAKELSEESKAKATNAWRLLHEWKTPPGSLDGEEFSAERFNEWLQRVRVISAETGHLEVALINAGKVLIYVPPDRDGLWINRIVASALNASDAENLRRGFHSEAYNSRGVHWVDPTGKNELELAEKYHQKAEAVENAGFHRFATTLRGLAAGYEQEAKNIVSEHSETGPS